MSISIQSNGYLISIQAGVKPNLIQSTASKKAKLISIESHMDPNRLQGGFNLKCQAMSWSILKDLVKHLHHFLLEFQVLSQFAFWPERRSFVFIDIGRSSDARRRGRRGRRRRRRRRRWNSLDDALLPAVGSCVNPQIPPDVYT